MGHDGHRFGRPPSGDRKNYFPGRPADAPDPRRGKKLPPGVEGRSLGGGPNRNMDNDGCAVTAVALAGGIVTAVAGAGYLVVEGVRSLI